MNVTTTAIYTGDTGDEYRVQILVRGDLSSRVKVLGQVSFQQRDGLPAGVVITILNRKLTNFVNLKI